MGKKNKKKSGIAGSKENFLKKIVIAKIDEDLSRKPWSAVKGQIKNVRAVWNSDKYKDFGIERLVRLFLVSIQFFFPGLYIREISGRVNTLTRKVCNEIYVIIKISLYLLALFVFPAPLWFSYLCLYLMVETIFYLLGLFFLEPEYKGAASYKRNLLMALVNFVEITLGFAVIYYCSFKESINELKTPIDAIYFSFVSATTTGYGDMYPKTEWSKLFCVFQNIVFFLFAVFIIAIYISNLNKNGFLNKDEKDQSKIDKKEGKKKD